MNKYISKNQYQRWIHLPYSVTRSKKRKKFIGNRRVIYPWVNIETNIVIWEKFWDKIFSGHKTDKVIDFGCGAGWGWLVGKNNGFDVIPFDIDEPRMKNIFKPFINILKTPVIYWDGIKMPFFKDNEFDSLIAKAAIMKCAMTQFDVLIKELCRITKSSGIWYISPRKHYSMLLKKLKNTNLKQILDDKNITITCWHLIKRKPEIKKSKKT